MLAGLLLLTVLAIAHGDRIKSGGCPTAMPLADFDMSRFLGKWYVIQKTRKSSRCLTFNHIPSSEPQKFTLEMTSEPTILRLLRMGKKYRISGDLTVPSRVTPARMQAKFFLGIASASYTVFDTDYDTYGAVFACQNLFGIGNRQAISILSRQPTLDEAYIDKIKHKARAFGIETSDLNVIDQSNCQVDETSNVKASVNDRNIAGGLHKGGEKQESEEIVEEQDYLL